MEKKRRSYTSYVLVQIMPALPGWRAAYWTGTEHIFGEVPLFAIVEPRMYPCHGCEPPGYKGGPLPDVAPPEEMRFVTGLEFYSDEGFAIVNEVDNYCGLFPPGDAELPCHHKEETHG